MQSFWFGGLFFALKRLSFDSPVKDRAVCRASVLKRESWADDGVAFLPHLPLAVCRSSCLPLPTLPFTLFLFIFSCSSSGPPDYSRPVTRHIKTTFFPISSPLFFSSSRHLSADLLSYSPLPSHPHSFFLFLLNLHSSRGDPSPIADSHRPWCPLNPPPPPSLLFPSRSVGSASVLLYTPSEC